MSSEGIISKIIRAKPDVIHYVDSPKIYRQEKAEPKSTNIKGKHSLNGDM